MFNIGDEVIKRIKEMRKQLIERDLPMQEKLDEYEDKISKLSKSELTELISDVIGDEATNYNDMFSCEMIEQLIDKKSEELYEQNEEER